MQENNFESQSPQCLDKIELGDNCWQGSNPPQSDADKRRLNSHLFERAMRWINTFGATEEELDDLSYWSEV